MGVAVAGVSLGSLASGSATTSTKTLYGERLSTFLPVSSCTSRKRSLFDFVYRKVRSSIFGGFEPCWSTPVAWLVPTTPLFESRTLIWKLTAVLKVPASCPAPGL